jgi:hypothetical protein
MKEKNAKKEKAVQRNVQVSQWTVRTGLRGGDCIDTCNSMVEDWRNRYYQLYEQSKYKTV